MNLQNNHHEGIDMFQEASSLDVYIPRIPKITLRKPVLSEEEKNECGAINLYLEERDNAVRKSLIVAFKLGRTLSHIRGLFAYGDWTDFVLKNTNYKAIPQAQADIRLWDAWKDKIIEIGGDTSDSAIKIMVDHMNEVSVSALMEFAKTNVPEYAMDLAIKIVNEPDKYGKLTGGKSKKLVECAKIIETLNSSDSIVARKLMEKWGVDNPDVIRKVPEIAASEELLESLIISGTVYVPNEEDGVEVSIDRASATDIDLALGIIRSENMLRQFATSKFQLKFVSSIEGKNAQEITSAFLKYLSVANLGTSEAGYEVRIYEKVENRQAI